MKMRIDKFISSQLPAASRSQVKKLLTQKRIAVNGKIIAAPDTKVEESDEVTLDGERIVYKKHIYIMLNKPAGYVCSAHEGNSPVVTGLVPEQLRRSGLFPAGRLDKDTEGFVLITDDGELAHNMLAPSRHVPKTYFVRLEKPYEERYAEIFQNGIALGEEKCRPAQITPDSKDDHACTLVIHEGKFHQVKRMFETLGNKVVYLKRLAIGSLVLDASLAPGECLEIMHKDVEKLLSHQAPKW